MSYPLRVTRYSERQSGGVGKSRGGNGVIKEYEFLEPAQLTLLTERRRFAPWGLAGGDDGAKENLLNGYSLPGKCSLSVEAVIVSKFVLPEEAVGGLAPVNFVRCMA